MRVQRVPRAVPAEETERARRREVSTRSDIAAHGAATGHAGPDAASLLSLQRTAGNAAVNAALAPLQRRAAGTAEVSDDTHVHGPGCGHTGAAGKGPTVADALRSPSEPLPPDTLMEMGSRLNYDFSSVRIHTGHTAHRSAKQLNAHAYTSGSHIVFQQGRYDIESSSGKRMLAHELIHVKQQHSGPVAGTDMGDGTKRSHPDDPDERAAEAGARRAMSRPAPVERSTGARPAAPSGTSSSGGTPEMSIQRCSVCRNPMCSHGDLCDRRPASRGRTPEFDRLDASFVTRDTMLQNPPGRRAVSQNQVMGGSAAGILRTAGMPPAGQAAHLHTAAPYSQGDGLEGNTQRPDNLTPGSQQENLRHKNYEAPVGEMVTKMLGVTVTQMGLSGERDGGRHKAYEKGRWEAITPGADRAYHADLNLRDYRSVAQREQDGDHVPASRIRTEMEAFAAHGVMDMLPPEEVPDEYRQFERRRRPRPRDRSSSPRATPTSIRRRTDSRPPSRRP